MDIVEFCCRYLSSVVISLAGGLTSFDWRLETMLLCGRYIFFYLLDSSSVPSFDLPVMIMTWVYAPTAAAELAATSFSPSAAVFALLLL